MRPQGRGPLDSLYFDYPHFDPSAPGALADPVRVAVVGAGPVGMVAALSLARHGQPCTLLDAKDTFNDGSRAICISRSSFNLLRNLGAVQPFLDKALPWRSGRSFFRGRQILEFDMPDSAHESYRPMYNLQQQYIEQFLYDAVAAEPLIDMRWQSEVTAIADTDGGALLSVRDPNGAYDLPAEWVLAADGARSSIRRMRWLRLKGQNYEGRYVIADIRMRMPVPVERFALFDPDARPGSTVLVHQQPDNIWRIDYQLRPGEDEDEALSEPAIRAAIAGVLRERGYEAPWDLEWWSIYSANTLLLDDYRDGPVFFVGDSAHIVPIFGVRGFNNGVLDGHNIGWKLAMVLQGRAAPALLDSYSPERRDATLDVFANASKSARFMTPHSRGYTVMRDAALSLALDHPFAGAFANPRQMTPYSYAASPLTRPDDADWPGGPAPGAAAPDVDLGDDFLLDRTGRDFAVLAFGDVPGLDRVADARIVALDAGGPAAAIYGAGAGDLYLLRPDGHVAGRWRGGTGRDAADLMTAILRQGRATP